jgi:hypothetical protein
MPRLAHFLVSLPLVAVLAACGAGSVGGNDVGGGDGHGDHHDEEPGFEGETPPPPPDPGTGGETSSGSFTLGSTVSLVSSRLNESKEVTLNLAPENGYSGQVALSVEGLTPGVTAKFTPEIANVSGPTSVTLSFSVASDAVANPNIQLLIRARDGAVETTLPLQLNVPAELAVFIAKGVNFQNDNPLAFGALSWPALFTPGLKVTFVNNDGVAHRIHAGGDSGLSHQNGNLAPNGGSYTDTLTEPGIVEFRCHIHGNMTGQLELK